MPSPDIEVPSEIVQKWQEIVNLLAEIIQVPAALVMKLEPPNIQVFVSSESSGNPYEKDEVACFDPGLYCERVIKSHQQLLVPDALQDEEWKLNPDVKLGMISYLGLPIIWPDGKIFGTICVLDDKRNAYSEPYRKFLLQCREVLQADLKLLTSAVREGEERFRLVANTAPVLIWMSGPDKLCNYFNQPWLEFTGRPIELELGNGWAAGVHHEDLERCLDTYTKAFDGRESFTMEYRLRRHDREYRWVLDTGVPRFNRDGSFVGYIGSCIDVTESKRAEDALRESQQRLLLAVQAGRMYAFEWDTATDVIVRSGEYADIFRWTDDPGRDTSREFLAKVHPDDRAAYTAVAEAGLVPGSPTYQTTFRVLRPDGSVVWLEESGRAYFDTQGRMLRIVGLVADVSGRKRAEEALASVSQRLIEAQEQERTRIARELHDDTNQRLAMLAMEIEHLRHDLPEPMAELHGRIDELRKHTLEISNDVRALAHELHPPGLEYVGLTGAARGFCQEFGEQQKVKIDWKEHDVPSPLPADISLCLFRVLQEALHNAAKHSGARQFEAQSWGTPGEIHLRIRDSGVGFHPDAIREGRGLGLISMQERVRLMKGTFSIESQPGLGTTIHVRLPLPAEIDFMRAAG